jgi:ribosome-associated protein
VRRYPVDDNTEPEEGTVSPPIETTDLVRIAADALDDKKGMDITLLDVGDLLSITEVFVIVTGTSRPHVRTLAETVDEKLKEHGRRPLRTEGAAEGEWVLLDYGDFVVHVFQETPRDFYGLERLWGDAPRVQWEPSVHSEG